MMAMNKKKSNKVKNSRRSERDREMEKTAIVHTMYPMF